LSRMYGLACGASNACRYVGKRLKSPEMPENKPRMLWMEPCEETFFQTIFNTNNGYFS